MYKYWYVSFYGIFSKVIMYCTVETENIWVLVLGDKIRTQAHRALTGHRHAFCLFVYWLYVFFIYKQMMFAFISVSLNKGERISIPQVHVNISSDNVTKTKSTPENKTLIKKRCKNQYQDIFTPPPPTSNLFPLLNLSCGQHP